MNRNALLDSAFDPKKRDAKVKKVLLWSLQEEGENNVRLTSFDFTEKGVKFWYDHYTLGQWSSYTKHIHLSELLFYLSLT